MKNEFIPYEQALALKGLGFDELCICIYNREKALRANVFNNPNDRFKSVQLSYNNGKIPAPLYQQAFRWFRDKYNLEFEITISCINLNESKNKKRYNINIIKSNEFSIGLHNKSIFNILNLKSYEEAELECLKKLIEIVKNK